MKHVTDAASLVAALGSGVPEIYVEGTITGVPMITLPPRVALRGGSLHFGAKGVRLTTDNTLTNITVITAEDEVAILNDTRATDLGTLTLRDVATVGQVLLVADDEVRSGRIVVNGLRIERADVRGRSRRPHGFGVEVLEGAFTVWNRQPDSGVVIAADLLDISAGSLTNPVRGSGVFVAGHGDWEGRSVGGTIRVSELATGEVHIDGGIPAGTPDLIAAGVFVSSGAVVERVTTACAVTTHGANDMVLDNWGDVRTWEVTGDVTSHGPSGIGFVNFGSLDRLDVRRPVRTYGLGARGFNLYDGWVRSARFASIATSGDGAVGIQVSKPMGSLTVDGDVATSGGWGPSLVKGVQVELSASALSVTSTGDIGEVSVGGRIATAGDGVTCIEIDGRVGLLDVAGGVWASGRRSDGAHVSGEASGIEKAEVHVADGRKIVRTDRRLGDTTPAIGAGSAAT